MKNKKKGEEKKNREEDNDSFPSPIHIYIYDCMFSSYTPTKHIYLPVLLVSIH